MALLQISEPGMSAEPHKHRLAVGIDLGTTNSLVATVRNGVPVVLVDEEGRPLLPSIVRYRADGVAEVGYPAQSMQARDPRLHAAPPLGIIGLAHLLRDAAACVCADSGAMHLAVALGTPTVALFSHSNPYHYAPLGDAHRTVLLANPYGVSGSEWARPVEGMPRSRLLRVDPEATARDRASRETSLHGADVVAEALGQILQREAR